MEKVKKIIIQLDLRNKIVWLSYIAASFIMWIVRPFFLNIPVVNAFIIEMIVHHIYIKYWIMPG